MIQKLVMFALVMLASSVAFAAEGTSDMRYLGVAFGIGAAVLGGALGQAKVAAAMQGTEEQMMEFIKANDSWFGKSGNQLDNVAELLQKILNEQKSLPTNMTKE